ncbi:hypothetical protein B0H13DRAFT_1982764 [Mycena leptocephala]|nr:hypothetical protein B0H13DRAFT_1982764 [Mycena leptocephala]
MMEASGTLGSATTSGRIARPTLGGSTSARRMDSGTRRLADEVLPRVGAIAHRPAQSRRMARGTDIPDCMPLLIPSSIHHRQIPAALSSPFSCIYQSSPSNPAHSHNPHLPRPTARSPSRHTTQAFSHKATLFPRSHPVIPGALGRGGALVGRTRAAVAKTSKDGGATRAQRHAPTESSGGCATSGAKRSELGSGDGGVLSSWGCDGEWSRHRRFRGRRGMEAGKRFWKMRALSQLKEAHT